MKKVVLSLIVGLFVVSCNSKPDKNDPELRAQAIVSCEKVAVLPETSDAKQKLAKEYCSCATDKMMGEFTYVEMMQMNSPSQELQDRLMRVAAPCLKDFQAKSAELGE